MKSIKIPIQLSRLARRIDDRHFWKSREWENWILYYSVPILMIVPNFENYLNHWVLLVKATHAMLQDQITREELNTAHNFLKKFVRGTEILYGKAAMTSNVHSLLHLPQKVMDMGPLWAHCGYPFESYNGKVQKMFHGPKGVILQICRNQRTREAIDKIKKNVRFRSCKIKNIFKLLCGKKTTCSIKSKKVRYFGKRRKKLEKRLMKKFDLGKHVQIFNKINLNRCTFVSCQKRLKRSDSSFAITKTGKFIQVRDFIYDQENELEKTIYKRIDVKKIMYENNVILYLVSDVSDELQIMNTNDIHRICVHIKVEKKRYIYKLPHTLRF